MEPTGLIQQENHLSYPSLEVSIVKLKDCTRKSSIFANFQIHLPVKSYLLQQAQLRLLTAVAQQLFLFLEFRKTWGIFQGIATSGDDSTTGFSWGFHGIYHSPGGW